MYINILIPNYNMPINNELLDRVLELNALAKRNVPDKKRFIFEELKRSKKRPFIGIVGLRGVGKTVLLRQLLKEEEHSIYISLDSFSERFDLFELIKHLNLERGYKLFLLDEIHFYREWQRDLKKIYDFLEVSVVFTSSVSLSLYKSTHDLGRRIILKELYPLSLREYLYLKEGVKFEPISIDNALSNSESNQLEYEYLFHTYINGGLIPAYMANPDNGVLESILNSIVNRDLPHLEDWTLEDVENAKLVLKFIANSGVDDISYSSISRNLGITKYKAIKYVDALSKSFLLSVIEPEGRNILKEPKIIMIPPFRRILSKDDSYDVGAMREEFFVFSIRAAGLSLYYLKGKRGEKTPDYLVKDNTGNAYILEVGGVSKGYSQFKGISATLPKYILTYPAKISKWHRPLFLMGFLV